MNLSPLKLLFVLIAGVSFCGQNASGNPYSSGVVPQKYFNKISELLSLNQSSNTPFLEFKNQNWNDLSDFLDKSYVVDVNRIYEISVEGESYTKCKIIAFNKLGGRSFIFSPSDTTIRLKFQDQTERIALSELFVKYVHGTISPYERLHFFVQLPVVEGGGFYQGKAISSVVAAKRKTASYSACFCVDEESFKSVYMLALKDEDSVVRTNSLRSIKSDLPNWPIERRNCFLELVSDRLRSLPKETISADDIFATEDLEVELLKAILKSDSVK